MKDTNSSAQQTVQCKQVLKLMATSRVNSKQHESSANKPNHTNDEEYFKKLETHNLTIVHPTTIL
jgi:hypothetical protein